MRKIAVAFAQSSVIDTKYHGASTESSSNVINNNAGVTINGTYYTISEFESLLDMVDGNGN